MSMRWVIAHSSSTTSRPSRLDVDRPAVDARRRAARRAPAWPSVASARPVRPGRCRPAAGRRRRASPRARRAGRCRRRAWRAPSGAQPTLSPMPTTTYGRAGCRRRLGEHAGQLASVEQQVVRPLQRRRRPRRPSRRGVAAASADPLRQLVEVRRHVAEQQRDEQVGARRRVPLAGRAGHVPRSGARRPSTLRSARPPRPRRADRRSCCPSRRRPRRAIPARPLPFGPSAWRHVAPGVSIRQHCHSCSPRS